MLTEYFEDQRLALDFLRAFTPLTLHIPPMATIERLAREQHIAGRLLNDPSTDNVRALAQWHGTQMRGVVKSFQKTTGHTVLSLRHGNSATNGTPSIVHRRRWHVIMPRRAKDCQGQMWLFD